MHVRVGAENYSEEMSLFALHLPALKHCSSKHARKELFLLGKKCFKLGDSFAQNVSLYLIYFRWTSKVL